MLIGPATMNALQFWIQDSFLMHKPNGVVFDGGGRESLAGEGQQLLPTAGDKQAGNKFSVFGRAQENSSGYGKENNASYSAIVIG